ncbi:hypothetical protein [Klebsiella quasipneumoniae]|uniref:hypothetical protein n=1 Tax=Klebsiella quasipneumoniae TaxID=1463165 RepID=UPI000DE5DBCB|nr:hypothetical protein [Klebsiella quasipneumoniae]SSF70457.1 Uncharacterised protein [Klebsiella quasipneumoniae]
MTKSTITREQLLEIIETDHVQCGEASYLARIALAAMDSEPVAWLLSGGGAKNVVCFDSGNAYADPLRKVTPLYRHAQPAPVVVPDGLRLALSNAGIAAPESDEMLAATCEKHIQALVTWVKDRKPFQSAPVALEDVLLDAKRWRALLGSARIQILGSAGFDAVVHPGENPDYRHFGMEIWTHYPDWPHEKNEYGINTLTQYADAMLQGGNSPVIPDCWCRTCRPVVLNDMRFVVCPDCGNKRCPRANDHRNACTGSNEPGQEGSAYPAAPQEVPDGK